MGMILVFAHPNRLRVNLRVENLKMYVIPYAGGELLSDAKVRQKVRDRMHRVYDHVTDFEGRPVGAARVVEEIMRTALEDKLVFWKDINTDVLVGTEYLSFLNECVSVKAVEEEISLKSGWKF
jgi:hypothetical protein